MSGLNAIEIAYDGDLSAIAEYMESTTLDEAATRFDVERATVQKWEQVVGAHCKRICECCREPRAYADMAVIDGKVTPRCKNCPPRAKRAKRNKPSAPTPAGDAQIALTPPAIYKLTRAPISPRPYTYWQDRGEWMLTEMVGA